jgi:hypothetical protein
MGNIEMATREQIIARAKELITQNPLWGKDRINKELRSEFGVGLRRIEVAKLKRVSPIPETARQVQLVVNRQQSLMKGWFLPEEAIHYSQFPISTAGMMTLRRFRRREADRAKKLGITGRRLNYYFRESYLARGFWDRETRRLDVNKWTKAVIGEIEKPWQRRKTIAIPADNYENYRKARSAKINAPDSLELTEKIPKQRWSERSQDYETLRNARFSHWEAMQIITAQTPPDKANRTSLQELDLNNPYWMQCMTDRIKWYDTMMALFRKKGMTPRQAANAIERELNNYYARDKKRKPWDWLADFSPTKSKAGRKQVDFIASAQKREDRLRAKKMPFRAVRAR